MRCSGLIVASVFFLLIAFSSSCKKEMLLTSGGELRFSVDTLNFDTVFTSMGSFTLQLKIFNPQSQKVKISSVRLERANNSFFHLNVNGVSGNVQQDIELAANDSIYVFATVNIDPTNDTTPFIVKDRLIATLNGNEYSLPFYAYGQNAYYLRDSVIRENAVWKTDKPYVILHSAAVDNGYELTIPAGCRIYMHADSRLYVLGKLTAIGTKADSIIFQGDRLDRGYFGNEDYPGEWGGIYFDSSSTGNVMEWCVLKNCGNNIGGGLPFAIEVFGKPGMTSPQLTLRNTIIKNSIGYGILAFQANIRAENCLVHDCGAQALAIFQGGAYDFVNCDFINYLPKKVSHTDEPTVAVLNYFPVNNNLRIAGDLEAQFTNCLIFGSLENELFVDKVDETLYNTTFTNCLVKHNQPEKPQFNAPHKLSFNSCKLNEDPGFEEAQKQNYRPVSNSVLVDNGAMVTLMTDLDAKPRPQGTAYDIGCYEFQP